MRMTRQSDTNARQIHGTKPLTFYFIIIFFFHNKYLQSVQLQNTKI